jgi:hypothetical protein
MLRSLFSGNKQQSNQNLTVPKVTSSVPVIALHKDSSSTIKTTQKLPSFQSETDRSVSNKQSNTHQLVSPTLSINRTSIGESHPTINSQRKDRILTNKSPDEIESLWDLDEINRFTRETFKLSSGNTPSSISDILVHLFR